MAQSQTEFGFAWRLQNYKTAMGATNQSLAEEFQVGPLTIHNWLYKKNEPNRDHYIRLFELERKALCLPK